MTSTQTAPLSNKEYVQLSEEILLEVEKAIVGKRLVLKQLLASFLCSGGHIVIEDVPGVAKTLIANSFARVLGLRFNRIQCTPDLLPADITGGYVYDSGQSTFELRQGPIFTNILLADEINRASPRTQSALLEAMQEHQVTLEGETWPLPEPFIVVATQNPIEYEGTFPLPEAQLDRFLIKLTVGYPDRAQEQEILARRRQRKMDEVDLAQIISPEQFLAMRQLVEEVHVEQDVERYIVEIVASSRDHSQVAVGSSPRGSLALLKLSRAWAALNGRTFVIPDDVKQLAPSALAHRLILEPRLWGTKTTELTVINQILGSVEVPVLDRYDAA